MGGRAEGRVPYGYRSRDTKLVLFEKEAAIVRRIYTDLQAGWRFSRIARELNRDHIPSPNSSYWSRRTVKAILLNSVYTGELHVVKHTHTAIISRRRWNSVQELLEARKKPLVVIHRELN